jgi:hypothetical protein
MHVFLKLKQGFGYDDRQPLVFDLKQEGGATHTGLQFMTAGSLVAGLPSAKPFDNAREEPGKWSIAVKENGIASILGAQTGGTASVYPDAIDDLWILVQYTVATTHPV